MKPKKPIARAIALSYEPGSMNAPQVCASGLRETAKRIESAARRYGVPVVKNRGLAEQLAELECREEIPSGLYDPVAELLVQSNRKRR